MSGRLAYCKRGKQMHHEIIIRDYFCNNPVYDDVLNLHMVQNVKMIILKFVKKYVHLILILYKKLMQLVYLVGQISKKCVVAIHMIGYGVPFDAIDEYTRATKGTTMESMERFMKAIRAVYEKQYFRQPTVAHKSCGPS